MLLLQISQEKCKLAAQEVGGAVMVEVSHFTRTR
jgi:hypothetical protein